MMKAVNVKERQYERVCYIEQRRLARSEETMEEWEVLKKELYLARDGIAATLDKTARPAEGNM